MLERPNILFHAVMLTALFLSASAGLILAHFIDPLPYPFTTIWANIYSDSPDYAWPPIPHIVNMPWHHDSGIAWLRSLVNYPWVLLVGFLTVVGMYWLIALGTIVIAYREVGGLNSDDSLTDGSVKSFVIEFSKMMLSSCAVPFCVLFLAVWTLFLQWIMGLFFIAPSLSALCALAFGLSWLFTFGWIVMLASILALFAYGGASILWSLEEALVAAGVPGQGTAFVLLYLVAIGALFVTYTFVVRIAESKYKASLETNP